MEGIHDDEDNEAEIREMVEDLPPVYEDLSAASREFGLHHSDPTFIPGHFRKAPPPPMPCADGFLAEPTLHTNSSLLHCAALIGAQQGHTVLEDTEGSSLLGTLVLAWPRGASAGSRAG